MRLRRLTPALVLVLAACGGAGPEDSRRSAAAPVMAMLADPAAPATVMLMSGRTSEGRAQLEQALAHDPDGMQALNDLAVGYAVDERFDAARQLLEEVLAQGTAREQQAALVNLGELYAIEGYLDAAAAHVASARAIDPSRPEPAYASALLADLRGDRAGTQAALKAAMDADRGGTARRDLAFVYPEERTHLDALVAEASGDSATAGARWRDLARSRFPTMTAAAQRHIEEP